MHVEGGVSLPSRVDLQFFVLVWFESVEEDVDALSSMCSTVLAQCPPSDTTGGRIYCRESINV